MAYDITFQSRVFAILRGAITDALSSGSAASGAGGRVYWQQAPDDAAYPYVIFQSQDNGGKRNDYLSANGWLGFVVFRVHSTDPDEADAIIAALPPLLQSISKDGYTVRALPERPIPYPPQDDGGTRIYTAALLCSAAIE